MLNEIHIIGRLGTDPEMKFTPNGVPVTKFRVASSRKYTVNEEQHEDTEWFTVVTWKKTAETCNQFLVKGQLVFVQGRVKLNTWEKQDGGSASNMEVTASNVIFLTKPKGAQLAPADEDAPPNATSISPDDLPF